MYVFTSTNGSGKNTFNFYLESINGNGYNFKISDFNFCDKNGETIVFSKATDTDFEYYDFVGDKTILIDFSESCADLKSTIDSDDYMITIGGIRSMPIHPN